MDVSALQKEIQKYQQEKDHLLMTQADLQREMNDLSNKLRDADRVKSEFLSNIRNEINNPLMAIVGLSSNIKNADRLQPELIRRWGDLINKEAVNLDFQLRNIFIAAEIEAGAATPQPVTVDIDILIEHQIQYFSSRVHERNVVLKHYPTDLRLFTTDATMVQHIIMNLLANAIEFSRPGSKVEIRSQILNQQLILAIEDTGIGINALDIKHVFDRFWQLDSGSTKMHRGNGLGLSIVKELTSTLQGQIQIESAVNEFTRVKIIIPEFDIAKVQGYSVDGEAMQFGEEEVL